MRVEQAAADEAPPTPAQLAELLKGPPLPAAQRSALLRNCASDVAEALSRAADAPNAAALKVSMAECVFVAVCNRKVEDNHAWSS